MKISMRDEKAVLQVIDLCSSLEDKALGVYETLLECADTERLRDLWSTLIADEKGHRQYWQRLKDVCAAGGVPEVFEEPKRYVDELQALMLRVEHLEQTVKDDHQAPGVFIHALKLEFLLLHPSFVTLFHYLPEDSDTVSPSRTYEQHLGRLLNTIMDYEELKPELELLGEMIGQVWKTSDEGAVKAVTDTLTGAHNRRGLYIAMKPLVYLARRERETAGVMIIEITNLKEINTRHGHKEGDRILAGAAKAISSRLRASDVVGRFGGDDFLALLTRFDDRHFENIGTDIIECVGKEDDGEHGVLLTIGGAYAVMGEEVESRLESLIREADGALETARANNMGCLVKRLHP